MRRFKVTYRSALIDPKRGHVCEGLMHSDGKVYLQGYTDEELFESREAMTEAVLLPQNYAFLSIEWIDDEEKVSIKQTEDTSLFNVMADAILRHYSANRHITLSNSTQGAREWVLAIYYLNVDKSDFRWKITTSKALEAGEVLGKANTIEGVQEIAYRHDIDLSKGWHLGNFS